MIRTFSFCLSFVLLEIRFISGNTSLCVERRLFYEYTYGRELLHFKSDSEMIANPKKACVTAYNSARSYGRSSVNRAFGGKYITTEQLICTVNEHLFYVESSREILLDLVKCVFSNGAIFSLSQGGFMFSVTAFKLIEHIPALADEGCADHIKKAKLHCLQTSPDYVYYDIRNLGGDELVQENVLMRNYIEGLEYLEFSSISKVTANESRACVTAYKNCRQYATFSSQGKSSHEYVTTELMATEIDHLISIQSPVVVSSQALKCLFSNGDIFAITPGGFMVSVTNFELMEHIPELADEKCLDLIYQNVWMESPACMTGKATPVEELALFHNYCRGERLQFEEGSKVTANIFEACVTAYNTSQTYGRSSSKHTSSNRDVTVKEVKSAKVDDLLLIRGPTKNVMSKAVKCLFKMGDTFAIVPGGFMISLTNFKIVEHVPALADKNCLDLIKAMKLYGVK